MPDAGEPAIDRDGRAAGRSTATDDPEPGVTTVGVGGRGLAPVVGVVLLIGLTVLLAASIAVGVGAWTLESPTQPAAFDLEVDAERSSISIDYRRGDPVDVEELSVTITVDGDRLEHQPPVPFVGADGFEGAPSGPFNAADDPQWEPGERAAVVVAGTNDPGIDTGDAVEVSLSVDGTRLATLETTAD